MWYDEENTKEEGEEMAVASLILGIIGMVFSCIAIGIFPALIGLILGIISASKNNKNKGIAIAGIITSVIAIIIFIIMLVIYSFVSKINTSQTNENEKQSESIEMNSISQDMEIITAIEKKVLYDKNGIFMEAQDLIEENGSYKLKIYVENDSEFDISLSNIWAANGIMSKNYAIKIIDESVVAGKKANIFVEIPKKFLRSNGIEILRNIDILFWIDDSNTYSDLGSTGQCRIETNMEEEANSFDSGKILYDKDGIRLDLLNEDNNTYEFSFINTTGKYVRLSVDDIAINDYMSSEWSKGSVSNFVFDTDQYSFIIDIDKDTMKLNGVSSIETMEFRLNIVEDEDYENAWNTDMIKVK